jgi:uncharacterized protein (TIGR04255 family)
VDSSLWEVKNGDQFLTRFSYANPPIIEAVLSIGFNASDRIDLPIHEDAIRQRCSEDYPNISRDFQNEFRVESGEHPQSKSTASQLGFCFVNAKKTQVFRIHKGQLPLPEGRGLKGN